MCFDASNIGNYKKRVSTHRVDAWVVTIPQEYSERKRIPSVRPDLTFSDHMKVIVVEPPRWRGYPMRHG